MGGVGCWGCKEGEDGEVLAGIDGVECGCHGEVVAPGDYCKWEMSIDFGGDLLMSDAGYAFEEGC